MTNSEKFFDDGFKASLIEAVFIQYQFQMSIYYKYAPDGEKNVLLSHADDCVYRYIY